MKEDTFEVNRRDNEADSAIEPITRAQQLKIEAHYKAEARRGWREWEESKTFIYVLLKTLGLKYLKCIQQEFLQYQWMNIN